MEHADDDDDNNNDAKDADENEDVDNGGEALPNFFKVIFFCCKESIASLRSNSG